MNQSLMLHDINLTNRVKELLDEFAMPHLSNRREGEREGFSMPVVVCSEDGKEAVASAIALNLSPEGLSLAHQGEPLAEGRYILKLSGPGKAVTKFRAQLEWSEAPGADWHRTGWSFLGLVRI
jgi:hypothetical protein